MLMMLAAADLGIGTCHSSVQDQELARKILGFPEGHFLAYLVSLGYPADGPLRPLKRLNRRRSTTSCTAALVTLPSGTLAPSTVPTAGTALVR